MKKTRDKNENMFAGFHILPARFYMLISGLFCVWAWFGLSGEGLNSKESPEKCYPVLTDQSVWRAYYTMRTPVAMTEKGPEIVLDKKKRVVRYCASPFPPAEWMEPDFDDSMWAMWCAKKFGGDSGYGYRKGGECLMSPLALLCLRGAFRVETPEKVKGLVLSLTYRGGFVAYLNGKEVARAHLPLTAKPTLDTIASEYPPDAQQNPEKRLRRAEGIKIPASYLRRGVNVLAVEIHRAPLPTPTVIGNLEQEWAACGLVRLELSAEGEGIVPHAKPDSVQAWQI